MTNPASSSSAQAVLITGGAGSVGRQLVDMFVEAGRAVRVFDLPMMDFSELEDRDGIEIIQGDITDASGVRAAVEGVDAVVHSDITPFWPVTTANPLHGLLGWEATHGVCVLAGVVALAVLVVRSRRDLTGA